MLHTRVINKAKQFETGVANAEIEDDERKYCVGRVYTTAHILVGATLLKRGPFMAINDVKPFCVDCAFNMAFMSLPATYSFLCQVMSTEITNTSERNIRLCPVIDPDMPDFGNYGQWYAKWQDLLQNNTRLHMTSLGATELEISFIGSLKQDDLVNITVRRDLSTIGSEFLVANVNPMKRIKGLRVRQVPGLPEIQPVEGAEYLFEKATGKPRPTPYEFSLVTSMGYLPCDDDDYKFLSDDELANLVTNKVINWRQLAFLNTQTQLSAEAEQFLNMAS